VAEPAPIVLRANHFQFGAGQRVAFESVVSCMQLWVRSGFGRVEVNGRSFELGPSEMLLMPWRHRITYQADRRKPFLVSGIHVVSLTDQLKGPVPFGHVAHDDRDTPGLVEGDHPLGTQPHLLKWEEHTGFREFSEFVVLSFLRAPPVESEQRRHARILSHEWSRALAQVKTQSQASPDMTLLHRYVNDHLDERLDVATLAKVLDASPSSVHRIVRRSVGESPAAWVQRLRVEEAQRRLSAARPGLAELARELGFCDEFHFSRVFKAHTGERPSQWRKRHGLI
jgi:AraC family transcriptional regulator